jgi:hypothetical protein
MTSANKSAPTTAVRIPRHELTDAAFAGMAEDVAYQDEALKLTDEFAFSDWEVLELD